jgi:hypothetical protein
MKDEELIAQRARESYEKNVGAPKGNTNAVKQSLVNLPTIDFEPLTPIDRIQVALTEEQTISERARENKHIVPIDT